MPSTPDPMQHAEAEPRLSHWHRLDRMLARLRPHREPLSLVIDAGVIVACWHFTYLFRIGFERWLHERPHYDGLVLAGVVGVYLIVFRLADVPKGMWRFSGFGEVKRLTIACFIAGLISAVVVLMAQLTAVPRAVLALHPVVSLMGVCMVRIAYRMLYEHSRSRITGGAADVKRALVMGAGDAAKRLLAGIHQQGWIVLGLLDDDPAKQGARIAGVKVLGSLADVQNAELRGAATHIITALPAATAAQRRRAIELASGTGLPVLTVPSVDELRDGRTQIERLRDVEPEDLLGREPVQLDETGIAASLKGKVVLITGAGGSIGSELCRQVAALQPAQLILYELSEFNLYAMEQELAERFPTVPLVRLVGDVKDLAHLRATWQRWRPQVVFHAAAFKHVPLMEELNSLQALRNNTLGSYQAGLVSAESGVERFVMISTDKAVNPSNVMGASKRAAEVMVSALAEAYPGTRFLAVRFGNVLGSSGSVIPKFKEQIAKGGPVTVTHPDIIRYFMTIREAARLVLQAALVGQSGQVLVLDMGEPVKIVELARQLIRLSGHTEQEIPIVFSGLRAGEKLFEELLADADTTLPTDFESLRIAQLSQAPHLAQLQAWLLAIQSCPDLDDTGVRTHLQALVPEFQPGPGYLQSRL